MTGDTAAMQAALSSDAVEVEIPAGTYRVSSVLTSTKAGRKIVSTGGVLFAATAEMTVLSVSGADVFVSVNIDGDNKANRGVAIVAGSTNYTVKGCNVKNIRSNNQQAFGIVSFSALGGSIENNIVTNVFSLGDGVGGNGNGMSRAIQYAPTTNPVGTTFISRNRMSQVMGEEGDAISIQIGDLSPFPDSYCIVSDNVIENFSRRACKIQGSRTIFRNNIVRSYGQNVVDLNPSSAVSVIASDACVVIDNQLYLDGKFPVGVNIDGSGVVTINGGIAKGNYVENPSNVGIQLRQTNRGIACDNYVKGTDCVGVEIQSQSSQCVAIGNICNIEHSGTTVNYIGVSGANSVAQGNFSVGLTGYRFIRVNSVGSIVESNHNLGTVFSGGLITGPGTGSAALARGSVIRGNTSSGDEVLMVNLNGGETFIAENGKRQGSGDSGITARTIWTNATPATARVNIYHDRGTVAWNKFATVGQPAGWVCTADGTPGTWVALPNL